eukprot:2254677-Rhodomonas_salina.1
MPAASPVRGAQASRPSRAGLLTSKSLVFCASSSILSFPGTASSTTRLASWCWAQKRIQSS